MLKKSIIIYTLIIGLISSCAVAKEQKKEEEINTYELLNIFGEVMERTKSSYVEDVTVNGLVLERRMVTLTLLPTLPRNLLTTSFKVCPTTVSPSISVI